MAISDYSTTAASNTTISGIDISGTTGKVKDGDNAIRQMMADIKAGVPYLSGTSYLIESTDAGAAVGPVFELYRNSATPANADILGKVLFNGEDSAGNTQEYASVEAVIVDVTSTSEDGQLDFYVTKAGSRTKFAAMTATATAFTAATSYTFDATVTPAASDGAALGTTSLMWSDLFLASGSVVNWNNGDVTITHAANTLTFAGASSGYVYDASVILNTASNSGLAVRSTNGTTFQGIVYNTTDSQLTVGTVTNHPIAFFTNNSSKGGISAAGQWTALAINPTANDSGALGASGTAWADLFLASGGVINFNAGDVTITHAANALAFAGASSGYSFDAALTAGSFTTDVGGLSMGTMSVTGATNGWQTDTNYRTNISNTGSGSTTRFAFYNANGNVGGITTSGSATSYATSSDERLKTNFRDFDSGALIDAIKVYHYDWKAGGSAYGPKAQELYDIFPDAVTVGSKGNEPGDEDFEPWSYDASKLMPLLIKEVQDLRARVAALEGN
jgi:hypothetical protein